MEKREFLEKYIADRHNTNCSKWDGLKEKLGRRSAAYVGGRHGI